MPFRKSLQGKTVLTPMCGMQMWSLSADISISLRLHPAQGNPRYAAICMAIGMTIRASSISMTIIFATSM